MNARYSTTITAAALSITCGLTLPSTVCCDDPADAPAERVSRAEARRQARLLHETIHSTLQRVHHEFYREDEGLPIPAAVIEDTFDDLEETQQVKLRWLVVEGQAMNTDHVAQNEFEKAAVKALESGREEYEWIEGNMYRRAGAISLTNACLKCHVPDRKTTENRTAGLIVGIPIHKE
ncbi:hypothetical protein Mal4_38300 [Maioricimonas rarisocia]|uniref:Tll0287-like domain-containing protein n=1 Tax=Maioricimonas rarisocia TaxID=2528026 RepID=A0A517ZAH1_9PLAN|nr:DUF3365 domain-containing protein [Maioricimonas rarisocia]QDU39485.1 hypothetical protein Mal4_38300 [Maioricimonas rarisocia]